MGGEHKLDLTSDVTHLLVGVSDALTAAHLTAKYKYVAANREDVRVLQPAWLEAVRQSWMTGKNSAWTRWMKSTSCLSLLDFRSA